MVATKKIRISGYWKEKKKEKKTDTHKNPTPREALLYPQLQQWAREISGVWAVVSGCLELWLGFSLNLQLFQFCPFNSGPWILNWLVDWILYCVWTWLLVSMRKGNGGAHLVKTFLGSPGSFRLKKKEKAFRQSLLPWNNTPLPRHGLQFLPSALENLSLSRLCSQNKVQSLYRSSSLPGLNSPSRLISHFLCSHFKENNSLFPIGSSSPLTAYSSHMLSTPTRLGCIVHLDR